MDMSIGFRNSYRIQCVSSKGSLRWVDEVKNLTTDEGLSEILDKFWRGANYNAAHYIALTGANPTFAATDNLNVHPGWAEEMAYDEPTRIALTLGDVGVQSLDNSASKALFTFSSTVTIGGAFISSDAVKGGAAGVLMGGAAFLGGDRIVNAGDQLEITVNLSAMSS